MESRTGCLKAVVLTALALLAILIAAVATITIGSSRRFDAEIARLKAAGEPTCIADLNNPPVMPSDNAAPIYQAAFNDLRSKDVVVLTWSLPALKDMALADKALRNHQAVFPQIELALSKPHCRFGAYSTSGPPFQQYAEFRNLARFLSAAAVVDAHYGRMDRAFYDLELPFRYRQRMEDHPEIIGYQVQAAIRAIGSSALREAVKSGQVSEAQFRSMDRVLASQPRYEELAKCLANERAFSVDAEMSQGVRAPYWHLGANWTLNTYGREIDILRGAKNPGDLARSPLPPDKDPFYAPMSGASVLRTMRYTLQHDMGQVAVDRTMLALEAYHGKIGTYPATLAELQSKLNWKAPKDECSGKDLIYKRIGKGYKLYSIGPDLTDDGGISWRTMNRTTANGAHAGDIVVERK